MIGYCQMFYRLQLFLAVNLYDLKHYLRLDLAPGSQVILQVVMVYNLIIWSIFLYQSRERFHAYLTGSASLHLNFDKEFRALFGNYYHRDREYLELRRYYRVYLGFWFILLVGTVIFFLPQTWQMALGLSLYHLLASLTITPNS
jgi:hypothetical protein